MHHGIGHMVTRGGGLAQGEEGGALAWGRGGDIPFPLGAPAPWTAPPLGQHLPLVSTSSEWLRSMCWRYASYWNAFLFSYVFTFYIGVAITTFDQEADVTRASSYACRDLIRLASDVYRSVSFLIRTYRQIFVLISIALEIIFGGSWLCHNWVFP